MSPWVTRIRDQLIDRDLFDESWGQLGWTSDGHDSDWKALNSLSY